MIIEIYRFQIKVQLLDGLIQSNTSKQVSNLGSQSIRRPDRLISGTPQDLPDLLFHASAMFLGTPLQSYLDRFR